MYNVKYKKVEEKILQTMVIANKTNLVFHKKKLRINRFKTDQFLGTIERISVMILRSIAFTTTFNLVNHLSNSNSQAKLSLRN